MKKTFFSQKGEIALAASIASFGLMLVGLIAGTFLAQNQTQLQSEASGCATISSVSQTPNSELELGQDFTCNVTIDSAHSGSRDISCGWSENGDWPQTGGRWEGATCNGVNCSFGIAAPSEVKEDAIYELVGFDMSSSCGPPTGLRTSMKLKGAEEAPPPDEENICKDKPDGYRAQYNVHEECDTNYKGGRWVIIDGICRDGEITEEPACATCDECSEPGTRDARSSSLARNECTPGGCDAPPPDDTGDGTGDDDGTGGTGDGNWCGDTSEKPVTCHGDVLNGGCKDETYCVKSSYQCADKWAINKDDACPEHNCPVDKSQWLTCHGKDTDNECFVWSFCAEDGKKCSDTTSLTGEALEDGSCPVKGNGSGEGKPPELANKGEPATMEGYVTIFNFNKSEVEKVVVERCEIGGGSETCNADGVTTVKVKTVTWDTADVSISFWKFSFTTDSKGGKITIGDTVRILKPTVFDKDGKQLGEADKDASVACTSNPCRTNFAIGLGVDQFTKVPIMTGKIIIENKGSIPVTHVYVTLCEKGGSCTTVDVAQTGPSEVDGDKSTYTYDIFILDLTDPKPLDFSKTYIVKEVVVEDAAGKELGKSKEGDQEVTILTPPKDFHIIIESSENQTRTANVTIKIKNSKNKHFANTIWLGTEWCNDDLTSCTSEKTNETFEANSPMLRAKRFNATSAGDGNTKIRAYIKEYSEESGGESAITTILISNVVSVTQKNQDVTLTLDLDKEVQGATEGKTTKVEGKIQVMGEELGFWGNYLAVGLFDVDNTGTPLIEFSDNTSRFFLIQNKKEFDFTFDNVPVGAKKALIAFPFIAKNNRTDVTLEKIEKVKQFDTNRIRILNCANRTPVKNICHFLVGETNTKYVTHILSPKDTSMYGWLTVVTNDSPPAKYTNVRAVIDEYREDKSLVTNQVFPALNFPAFPSFTPKTGWTAYTTGFTGDYTKNTIIAEKTYGLKFDIVEAADANKFSDPDKTNYNIPVCGKNNSGTIAGPSKQQCLVKLTDGYGYIEYGVTFSSASTDKANFPMIASVGGSTNESFARVIQAVSIGSMDALEVSAFISQLTSTPGIKIQTCRADLGECDVL
ncbi:hypothetical protein HYW55_00010 [Candidatus Gottesmanbacteria bacterium]|nr:hypothetical protein [Candidatus Gottesmanbacteria bacterium]